MGITHGATSFGGINGVMHEGTLNVDLQREAYSGVHGVSLLTGPTRDREISCSWVSHGYASEPLVRAATLTIARLSGTLFGTVTDTNTGSTWGQCMFLGLETQQGYPKRDAATNTWFLRGRLRWLQRVVT